MQRGKRTGGKGGRKTAWSRGRAGGRQAGRQGQEAAELRFVRFLCAVPLPAHAASQLSSLGSEAWEGKAWEEESPQAGPVKEAPEPWHMGPFL